MIDWFNLAANSLWILGVSIWLATLSYTRGKAMEQGLSLSHELNKSTPQGILYLGALLFSLGLSATSSTGWEKVLWVFLAVAFAVQALITFRQGRKSVE